MFFRIKLNLFVACFILQTCKAAVEILRTVDNSITQQLLNPDSTPQGVRLLLADLRFYKQNLYKLTSTITSKLPDYQKIREEINLMTNPDFFAKAFDFNYLQQAFNLSEKQCKFLGSEIKGILMNWKQIKLVASSDPPYSDDAKYLPFYLLQSSGNRLVFILEHALPSQSQEMFEEFCSYYYALGKLLKLIKSDDEECLTRSQRLYQEEKPIFLQQFVGVRQIMYKMGLSVSERRALELWMKKIYIRWFKFMNVYKRRMNLIDKPNFMNLQLLQKTDDMLVKLINENNDNRTDEIIEGLKTFNKYLRLIMRRNYPFRSDVLEAGRRIYKTDDPLFLRKIYNNTDLNIPMNINMKSLCIMEYFINEIAYKWAFFVGLEVETKIPKKRTTVRPILFKSNPMLLTTPTFNINLKEK